MREILFRGKQEYKNKEWVFGSLHSEYGETDKNGQRKIDYRILGMRGECDYVLSETVGQFTGLTDKNGKKIFEGDIIRTDNGRTSAVSVVKYGDYMPKMFYRMFDEFCPGRRHLPAHGIFAASIDKDEEMILFNSPLIEVIGNIHDNPELLKEA